MECVEVNVFRQNLRRICDERGAMVRISRAANVSPGYLYRVLRGERMPTIDIASRVARASGSSLVQMLSAVDPESGG